MYEKSILFGIYTVTPLHAGSGTIINSPIDLPIQRERHTSFPIIQGQSLKGAMRSYYSLKTGETKKVEEIFGPEVKEGQSSGFASAISVSDAKILLFPVRSLSGVFAYVTSPYVLQKLSFSLKGHLSEQKILTEFVEKVSNLIDSDNKAIISSDSKIKVLRNNKCNVVLEDILLSCVSGDADLNKVSEVIQRFVPADVDIKNRLVVVSDNVFKLFVTMYIEVVARIKIEQNTHVVKQGGLWYEEFLPSDTLLYTTIFINNPRKEKPEHIKTAKDIQNELKDVFGNATVQVGGDETVGKGLTIFTVFNQSQREV